MENSPISPTTDETVIFKRSHFYSVMVVFAFAVGILVGYMAWGRGPSAPQAAAEPAQAQAQAPTRYDIPIEGFPSLGPEDAEIVMVEFSDYQ